jgi:SET domain-containing protein
MSRRPFRVGRSRTGLGLFATKPIKKKTIIVYYRGQKITAAESEKREARGNRYLYEINSKWVMDGASRRNVARYANHSCRPNCESDTRGHEIFIKAIKNIEPGDEITYHYGKNYFDMFLRPIGCKCPKCIEKRREERSAKLKATKRRKAREARKAAEARAARRKAAARKAKTNRAGA